MAKFTNPSKLLKEEQEKLFFQFCSAISKLNNPLEVAEFLKDLLSAQEVEMLAKRLKIAELLIIGFSYSRISYNLKVGFSTIARVHEWLKMSGSGYRMVLKRISDKDNEKDFSHDEYNPLSWRSVKKKYPLYYWPELLLETVINSAKENEKRRFKTILKTMDKKSDLYQKLNKILNN